MWDMALLFMECIQNIVQPGVLWQFATHSLLPVEGQISEYTNQLDNSLVDTNINISHVNRLNK